MSDYCPHETLVADSDGALRCERCSQLVNAGSPEPDEPRYWGNPLNSFENGVQLDLRAKLAKDFLCQGLLVKALDHGNRYSAGEMINFAQALAAEFIDQAATRGWLKPLPDPEHVPVALRDHIRRNIAAQVFQGQETQRQAAAVGPQVGIAPPGMLRS